MSKKIPVWTPLPQPKDKAKFNKFQDAQTLKGASESFEWTGHMILTVEEYTELYNKVCNDGSFGVMDCILPKYYKEDK